MPTPASAQNELGVISLAQGGIYRNGFYDVKYYDGVYGRFWPGAMGFQEMMGDIIGAEAANAYENQIGCPNKVTLDNGTVVLNPSAINTQYGLLRTVNKNAQSGSNPTYYEWAYMYNMIVAANTVLDITSKTTFSGAGATTKAATLQAWAYFWKGFAYAHIGSIYYAGLIQNSLQSFTNGNYVSKDAIIAESNANFDKASAALDAAASATDYTTVFAQLVPTFLQKGKGGVLTTAMFRHNISTMKARNILVNTTVSAMTSAQWNSILTLTAAGITSTDLIFTGRSDANGDFLGAGISVADKASSPVTSTGGYKLSERFVQEFKAGDKRKTNNVLTLANAGLGIFNQDRGNSFNTRYTLSNKGTGVAGTIVYANSDAGGNEITLAGTYEENELMKAEANLKLGNIATGLASVDAVRTYQGAGISAVSGVVTDAAAAYEEFRRERRVALAFKGLSFYDARRWEIIDPAKSRTGCVVVAASGAVNTNATINYGFLDYWDVPDNELAYNPASATSAPVKNPK
ncbi:MAG: RagB/SusD family nutrient uptake outer membrane protein [Chitinophagaceae bacterium]